MRVVDHVGVGSELRDAFDVRPVPAEEIAAFVIGPFTGEPDESADTNGSVTYRTEGRDDGQRATRAEVADRLLATLNQRRLLDIDDGPHLHASSVVDADGRALIAVAHSHGGKSTFAAHLVHRGLSVVNDEQTRLLPDHGVIGAFRRPLAIKAQGVEHLPIVLPPVDGAPDTRLVAPAALGGRWQGSGRPVLVVVLARDDEHVGPVGVRWLAPSEVVVACCANNLDLARDPERALEAFAWLASTAAGVELTYGSSAEAAAVGAELLAEVEPRSIPYAVQWDDDEPSAEGADEVRAGEIAERPTEVEVHEVVLAPTRRAHDRRDATRSGLRWRRSGDVVTVGIGGEAVLYHRQSRAVARLNAGAAQRWVDLGEETEEVVDDDTERLWQQLAEEDLVVSAEAGALRTQR